MKCHEIANPLFFLLVLRVGTNYSITVINKTYHIIGIISLSYQNFNTNLIYINSYYTISSSFSLQFFHFI
jgi:hypothetical protein